MGVDRLTARVSLVVPTLNEAATLRDVLRGIAGHGDEVFVMDGHSTDGTREIAASMGVTCHCDGGLGKGDAVRRALRIARHPIVVFVDGDGSHEPADIPRLVEPIRRDQADLVIGSRLAGGSDELCSDIGEFVRLSGSLVINLGINYRWNVRLSDTQNGFRAVWRDVGLALELQANDTTIEQEMVMKALIRGYRVTNVSSHEYRRRGGESKVLVSRVWLPYVLNVLRHAVLPSRRSDK